MPVWQQSKRLSISTSTGFEDFPEKSAEFGQLSVSVRRNEAGEMVVAREAIPEMPAELQQIIEEMK